MSVLAMKSGKYLCSPSPVRIKFPVNRDTARPGGTSGKGDASTFWLRQEMPSIVVYFLRRKETDT